jgi:nucleoside-diphosphate-sugar epimerase
MSLFAFGLGYSAACVVARGQLGSASGTVRDPGAIEVWRARGVEARLYDPGDERMLGAIRRAAVALSSIPPDVAGDPVLRDFAPSLTGLRRLVYLSTVGVYGDCAGDWVDEESPTLAVTPRARARIAAETAWSAFGAAHGVPVDILRLGGIYGPGRSAFDRLREGNARRVVKPGQVFNRIHVEDIAAAVETVVAAGRPGAIYNVVDGAPSPPQDVIVYAAERMGVPPPPEEPFAQAGLSGMALSFYEENRRVRNERLRALGWSPAYATYREGLEAIWAMERGVG